MNKTIRPEDPRFLAALNRAWIEVTRTREPAGDPEKLTKWVRWPGERCAPASHDFVAGFVAGTTFVESHLESQACSTASSPRSEGSCAGAGGTGGSSAPPAGVEEQEKAPTGTEHAGPAPAAAAAGDVLPPAEMPLALLPYWTPHSRVYKSRDGSVYSVYPAAWWVSVNTDGVVSQPAIDHDGESYYNINRYERLSNRPAPAKACECGGTADPALCQRRDCARKVK